MSTAITNATVVRDALEYVTGGGDMSTEDLMLIQEEALGALEALEDEAVWLAEKIDNVEAEIRRLF